MPCLRRKAVLFWHGTTPLFLAAFGVAFAIVCLIGWMLLDSRRDAWNEADMSVSNLTAVFEREIVRKISTYDLSLQSVIQALRLPGLDAVSPDIRAAALFDNSANAPYLDPIVVTDASGDITLSSVATKPASHLSLAHLPEFLAQVHNPNGVLYVGGPFRSLLTNTMGLALSRRIAGPDGRFRGIVAGSVELGFFETLVHQVELGADGNVALLRDDGMLLMRWPPLPGTIGKEMPRALVLEHARKKGEGTFTSRSPLDGVPRLYAYTKVGDLPLIIVVGRSYHSILSAWRLKASVIGAGTLLMGTALTVVAALLARELRRRGRAERELAEANAELSVQAVTDPLTGLANRRRFDDMLRREWRRALRTGRPISLLMLDADQFKSFNDTYGHGEGDVCLQVVARCIQNSIRRPGDLAARYGGEEFVVILPDTFEPGALRIAEAIRTAVREEKIPHAGTSCGHVSVSIGAATIVPDGTLTEAELLAAADACLYRAKQDGRDRVRTTNWPDSDKSRSSSVMRTA